MAATADYPEVQTQIEVAAGELGLLAEDTAATLGLGGIVPLDYLGLCEILPGLCEQAEDALYKNF